MLFKFRFKLAVVSFRDSFSNHDFTSGSCIKSFVAPRDLKHWAGMNCPGRCCTKSLISEVVVQIKPTVFCSTLNVITTFITFGHHKPPFYLGVVLCNGKDNIIFRLIVVLFDLVQRLGRVIKLVIITFNVKIGHGHFFVFLNKLWALYCIFEKLWALFCRFPYNKWLIMIISEFNSFCCFVLFTETPRRHACPAVPRFELI